MVNSQAIMDEALAMGGEELQRGMAKRQAVIDEALVIGDRNYRGEWQKGRPS